MNVSCRIVFMGTPVFAVPALQALIQAGYPVAMVVTQPDRPVGRGRKILFSEVKQIATEMGLPVYQPENLKTADSWGRIRDARPDVMVVVAYGQLLPSVLLRMPPWGCLNIHASLLPRYRGPAPIQRAVINREPETGVTIMKMDSGLDTGDILYSRSTPILPEDTAATLHDRLASMGADLLLHTLENLESVYTKATPQEDALATYAPMLTKADGRIDWSKPADDIDALIRGTQPWPGAYTFVGGRRLKVFRGRIVPRPAGGPPGSVLPSPTEELWIATGSGILSLVEVQPESGRRMSITDFLKGRPVQTGSILSE